MIWKIRFSPLLYTYLLNTQHFAKLFAKMEQHKQQSDFLLNFWIFYSVHNTFKYLLSWLCQRQVYNKFKTQNSERMTSANVITGYRQIRLPAKKAMKANSCERAACLGEDGCALSNKHELENQWRKQMWDVSIFRKLCHVTSINTNTLLAVRLSITLPLFCVCVFVTATAYDFIVQTSHRALKHPLTWHNS